MDTYGLKGCGTNRIHSETKFFFFLLKLLQKQFTRAALRPHCGAWALHSWVRAVSGCRGWAPLQLRCAGFSLRRLLLLWSSGSRAGRLSGCGIRAPERTGSGPVPGGLHYPAACGILLFGRQILNHWTTSEVVEIIPLYRFLNSLTI